MATSGVDAGRLASSLRADAGWRRPIVLASTGSTNADLASGSYGWAAGTVLIANHQSAGRGRFDRRWEAAPGQAIATSVLLRPSRPLADWGWLSFLVAMAVQRALAGFAEPGRVQLKWPNDVLVDGRKICGILSEARRAPDGSLVAICGWGLNVAMNQDQLPVPTATSTQIAGLAADHDQLAAGMLNALDTYYRLWDDGVDLREQYLSMSGTIGRQVRVQLDAQTQPGQFFEGTATGLASDGSLIVSDGRTERSFAAGDVIHLR